MSVAELFAVAVFELASGTALALTRKKPKAIKAPVPSPTCQLLVPKVYFDSNTRPIFEEYICMKSHYFANYVILVASSLTSLVSSKHSRQLAKVLQISGICGMESVTLNVYN